MRLRAACGGLGTAQHQRLSQVVTHPRTAQDLDDAEQRPQGKRASARGLELPGLQRVHRRRVEGRLALAARRHLAEGGEGEAFQGHTRCPRSSEARCLSDCRREGEEQAAHLQPIVVGDLLEIRVWAHGCRKIVCGRPGLGCRAITEARNGGEQLRLAVLGGPDLYRDALHNDVEAAQHLVKRCAFCRALHVLHLSSKANGLCFPKVSCCFKYAGVVEHHFDLHTLDPELHGPRCDGKPFHADLDVTSDNPRELASEEDVARQCVLHTLGHQLDLPQPDGTKQQAGYRDLLQDLLHILHVVPKNALQ
mmetsp:Transcript_23729/g.74691  ORF Transcript_23729/g.74691 Transcript_23729/m.74691 type:complete len:307 (-) Transcript_23729:123-1043(-)